MCHQKLGRRFPSWELPHWEIVWLWGDAFVLRTSTDKNIRHFCINFNLTYKLACILTFDHASCTGLHEKVCPTSAKISLVLYYRNRKVVFFCFYFCVNKQDLVKFEQKAFSLPFFVCTDMVKLCNLRTSEDRFHRQVAWIVVGRTCGSTGLPERARIKEYGQTSQCRWCFLVEKSCLSHFGLFVVSTEVMFWFVVNQAVVAENVVSGTGPIRICNFRNIFTQGKKNCTGFVALYVCRFIWLPVALWKGEKPTAEGHGDCWQNEGLEDAGQKTISLGYFYKGRTQFCAMSMCEKMNCVFCRQTKTLDCSLLSWKPRGRFLG